jgi:hypothetical protein
MAQFISIVDAHQMSEKSFYSMTGQDTDLISYDRVGYLVTTADGEQKWM